MAELKIRKTSVPLSELLQRGLCQTVDCLVMEHLAGIARDVFDCSHCPLFHENKLDMAGVVKIAKKVNIEIILE